MASVAGVESDAAGGVDGVSMRCPRVKPEHAPYRPAGGRIRIGGEIPGVASNLEDPSGAIWALLESMDGTRAVEEIADCVVARCPEQSRAAVTVCVQQLIDAGYVEDAPAPAPAGLSAREQQLRLREARATVLGVGASGGSAALALTASGVGRLHVVDIDVLELSNLNRQILYVEEDVGRVKVEAAIGHLRALNSDITVTGEQALIGSIEDIERYSAVSDERAVGGSGSRHWTLGAAT